MKFYLNEEVCLYKTLLGGGRGQPDVKKTLFLSQERMVNLSETLSAFMEIIL